MWPWLGDGQSCVLLNGYVFSYQVQFSLAALRNMRPACAPGYPHPECDDSYTLEAHPASEHAQGVSYRVLAFPRSETTP